MTDTREVNCPHCGGTGKVEVDEVSVRDLSEMTETEGLPELESITVDSVPPFLLLERSEEQEEEENV